LHREPLDPWAPLNYTQQRELTSGLLHANKTVHCEASSVLYGQNRFDFTTASPEEIASFFRKIGFNNANYIRHVCVKFPSLRDLEPGNVTITEGSIAILANIQTYCANLSMLTTSLYSTNATELKLDSFDYPKIVTEALKLVNTRFRAISSLQDIIVEVFEDSPSDYVRTNMESHGWTISAIEYVEEWGSDDIIFWP
jgi:hypothetical protein